MPVDDLMTIGDAAEAFHLHRIKIYRWIRDGRLVAYRSARDERAKLVRRADVEALLEPEPVTELSDTASKDAA